MQKSEKLNKQMKYQSALYYINSKGFDIETILKRGKPEMVELTVMKDGSKFIDSKGNDRVKKFPFESTILSVVADSVIKLSIYLKSKEQ